MTNRIERFKNNNVRILSNVRISNEGIDIKKIDAIMFICKKESPIEIIQCLGWAFKIRPQLYIKEIT